MSVPGNFQTRHKIVQFVTGVTINTVILIGILKQNNISYTILVINVIIQRYLYILNTARKSYIFSLLHLSKFSKGSSTNVLLNNCRVYSLKNCKFYTR